MTTPAAARALGDVLREGRNRLALTLRDVADWAGLDFTYISKVENGHERPSDGAVRRLCALYGIDPEPLLLARAIEDVPEPVRAAISAAAHDRAIAGVAGLVAQVENADRWLKSAKGSLLDARSGDHTESDIAEAEGFIDEARKRLDAALAAATPDARSEEGTE